jgi:uncharacterized membrane protein
VIRVRADVTVARPVADVFAYWADPARLPEWQEGVTEVSAEPSGPMQLGTRIHQARQVAGYRVAGDIEVTRLEEDRLVVFEGRGTPVRVRGEARFEPAGDGTHVDTLLELELPFVMALASPMISRLLTQQAQSDLARLKAQLEAPPPGS